MAWEDLSSSILEEFGSFEEVLTENRVAFLFWKSQESTERWRQWVNEFKARDPKGFKELRRRIRLAYIARARAERPEEYLAMLRKHRAKYRETHREQVRAQVNRTKARGRLKHPEKYRKNDRKYREKARKERPEEFYTMKRRHREKAKAKLMADPEKYTAWKAHRAALAKARYQQKKAEKEAKTNEEQCHGEQCQEAVNSQ